MVADRFTNDVSQNGDVFFLLRAMLNGLTRRKYFVGVGASGV